MFRPIIACLVVVLLLISSQPGFASTGATFTLNPDLRQAILILDNGARVTMNANTNVFTVLSPYGQTYTFTFAAIAQDLAGTSSGQQALIQQWRNVVSDPSTRLTTTNSHEPTLSLAPETWGPPPGHFEIEGGPEVGIGTFRSAPGSDGDSGTETSLLSSGGAYRPMLVRTMLLHEWRMYTLARVPMGHGHDVLVAGCWWWRWSRECEQTDLQGNAPPPLAIATTGEL